ncbi:hypothetical protein T265_15123, partial [Opisthorchis viverrini]
LLPDLYLRKFNCEAFLAACGQEPQNQPASAATVVTLYFTRNGRAPFRCVEEIAVELRRILNELEIRGLAVEECENLHGYPNKVLGEINSSVHFHFTYSGFEIKSRFGSVREASVHTLNGLFELRKDFHARWLDPLKVMKPAADKCLWIDDGLGQIVFSVYFDISNLKEETFSTNADQVSELKDPVNPNSETDIYIQQLLCEFFELLYILDFKLKTF